MSAFMSAALSMRSTSVQGSYNAQHNSGREKWRLTCCSHAVEGGARRAARWRKGAPAVHVALHAAPQAVWPGALLHLPVALADHLWYRGQPALPGVLCFPCRNNLNE